MTKASLHKAALRLESPQESAFLQSIDGSLAHRALQRLGSRDGKITTFFPAWEMHMRDLVVLIPGILGSILRRDGHLVWGYSAKSISRALLTGTASFRKDLMLDGDDPARDHLDDGVIADGLMPDLHLVPGFWKIDGYSAVKRQLCASFDLIPGRNYFEFAYDWRRDNRANARLLAKAVHRWLTSWRASGASDAKVVFVAHSMGGLVARYYLEVLGGWRTGSTRALITIGTPYRGSLNALNNLANGVSAGPITLSAMTDICRSCTSPYQLLPIFPCYDCGDGQLVRVGEATGIPNLDANRARDGLAFHHEIRDAVAQNRCDPKWDEYGYAIYPVVGRAQPTNYVGRLTDSHVVMSEEYNGETLGGDGTVPRVSAIPLEFDDLGHRADMYATPKHGSLQNSKSVLDHLAGRINDFYTQFGGFRDIALNADEIGIKTPDLVTTDEPVTVHARPRTPRMVTVSLYASRNEPPIRVVTLPAQEDPWIACQFDPLPEGVYRAVVTADASLPTEESFAVGDISRTVGYAETEL